MSIVGARPQFVKAAVVSHALRAMPGVEEALLHTGQHYDADMSDVFFSELGIPRPDFELGVGSAPHGAQTGRMLAAIEQVLLDHRPDRVVVYGDTNSTLAGALAAAKLGVAAAHVEAGLRSFNRRMPEEINRVVADHVCDLLLAPTAAAVRNLRDEGIPHDRIRLVGDVMYDAALAYGERAAHGSDVLARLGVEPGSYLLCTLHRAENTDDPATLARVFAALRDLAARYRVVLPLHPRTRAALERHGVDAAAPGLLVTAPVGYLDMTMLERSARLVLTDSGGVQKEAYFHRVPCVTLRRETEWIELVEAGWNTLVPPEPGVDIAGRVEALLASWTSNRPHPDFYGDGASARRVAAAIAGNRPTGDVPTAAGTRVSG